MGATMSHADDSTLTASDRAMFQRLGISPATLAAAGVRRVTHAEARDVCGLRYSSDHLEGVAFPYHSVATGAVVCWRVRRDHPEAESDGTPIAKYLSSPDGRHFYVGPGASSHLTDVAVSVVLVEAEKSVLAILDAAGAMGRTLLPIGLGGCWGWKGTIGKQTAPDGTRVDEKGPLSDFNLVTWKDRHATIVLDSNAASNPKVAAARRALTAELERRGARVHIVDLPPEPGSNGPDDHIGRHGAVAFMALLDAARLVTRATDDDAEPKPRKSQATELVELTEALGVELWHTPSGDPFATVRVADHREHHPLRRVVRDYLSREYYRAHKRSATSAALTDATATLSGMARYDGAEHPVAVRLAAHDGAVYLDLGTPDWQAVQIDATGWRLVHTSPVRHWRPGSLRALPVPTTGGTLETLRTWWPVDDTTWTLAVSWLVAAAAPAGPYPVLVETGEQGSGKSTFGKMLRGLVDPAAPALRGVPRDERDVMIGALTSHIVALDNLSGLPAWLSDVLCRVATGGGLATRTLYSDLDETTIDVCKPILLTGIDNPAGRGDLLDRSLVITLPAIADEARGDERRLWARYEAMRPALVGALLDAVACALRGQSSVVLEKRPRMADACTWVTAAEPSLGWAAGVTAKTWIGAREVASADLIATDPVAQAVMALGLPWTGSAGALLEMLATKVTDHASHAKTWPASPRGLSSALRRLAPDLRRAGIDVVFPTDARTARERVIEINTNTCDSTGRTGHTGQTDKTSVNSVDSTYPVVRPVAPTGHQQDVGQDADTANESGLLSGLSGLSGSTRRVSGHEMEVPRGRF